MAATTRVVRVLSRRMGIKSSPAASLGLGTQKPSGRWLASSATGVEEQEAFRYGQMPGWVSVSKELATASSSSSSSSSFNTSILLSSSIEMFFARELSEPKRGLIRREAGQRRSMFIQTQSTPNPDSLMFQPGRPVMEVGSSDFPNARVAMQSPLAKALFSIDGVTRVFFGADFVTITKEDEMSWAVLKPQVFATIMEFYSTKQPLFYDAQAQASDTAIHEDDDETVAMIKELLETRIRPAVQDDGGDIEYRSYDAESGIVSLKMQGACSGCPSSAVTLKSGIENMLMHYVPEVKGVVEVHDSDSDEEESASPAG